MEFIPNSPILNFNPDTLQYLRNQYGFDTIKRLNDAIDILETWAGKQEHFEKKSFDRGFLERLLIFNKGSVEKCKKKMDKLCTQRTLLPEFFKIDKIDRKLFSGVYTDVLLRELTPDHGRVYFLRFRADERKDYDITAYLKYFVVVFQYVQMKDYCNHVSIVIDWQTGSVMEVISKLDVLEYRKSLEINFQGYSMRLKSLHLVNTSKAIEAMANIIKTLLGPKLGNRVLVHKTMDAVYEHIPKEIFPQEYGGKDKSISLISDEMYNELYSPEFTEYRKEMNKARTNEALRQRDKFNEEYLGMSGTFRTLSVD